MRRLFASFRNAEREVTVRLVHRPGELAQVDFFAVWVELAARQKAWLLLMRLMHSGRDFTTLCAQQDTTWLLAAHVAAFAHFAGLIAAVAYDNLTAAVAKILMGAVRGARRARPVESNMMCSNARLQPAACGLWRFRWLSSWRSGYNQRTSWPPPTK